MGYLSWLKLSNQSTNQLSPVNKPTPILINLFLMIKTSNKISLKQGKHTRVVRCQWTNQLIFMKIIRRLGCKQITIVMLKATNNSWKTIALSGISSPKIKSSGQLTTNLNYWSEQSLQARRINAWLRSKHRTLMKEKILIK